MPLGVFLCAVMSPAFLSHGIYQQFAVFGFSGKPDLFSPPFIFLSDIETTGCTKTALHVPNIHNICKKDSALLTHKRPIIQKIGRVSLAGETSRLGGEFVPTGSRCCFRNLLLLPRRSPDTDTNGKNSARIVPPPQRIAPALIFEMFQRGVSTPHLSEINVQLPTKG